MVVTSGTSERPRSGGGTSVGRRHGLAPSLRSSQRVGAQGSAACACWSPPTSSPERLTAVEAAAAIAAAGAGASRRGGRPSCRCPTAGPASSTSLHAAARRRRRARRRGRAARPARDRGPARAEVDGVDGVRRGGPGLRSRTWSPADRRGAGRRHAPGSASCWPRRAGAGASLGDRARDVGAGVLARTALHAIGGRGCVAGFGRGVPWPAGRGAARRHRRDRPAARAERRGPGLRGPEGRRRRHAGRCSSRPARGLGRGAPAGGSLDPATPGAGAGGGLGFGLLLLGGRVVPGADAVFAVGGPGRARGGWPTWWSPPRAGFDASSLRGKAVRVAAAARDLGRPCLRARRGERARAAASSAWGRARGRPQSSARRPPGGAAPAERAADLADRVARVRAERPRRTPQVVRRAVGGRACGTME